MHVTMALLGRDVCMQRLEQTWKLFLASGSIWEIPENEKFK